MEIKMIRNYLEDGTNGTLWIDGELICYTIELPWRDNRHGISCIPEGTYQLSSRSNRKFGKHFELLDVENRANILMHPANKALTELKGCIAPVCYTIGHGEGEHSREAMKRLVDHIYPALEKERVFITIKSKDHDNYKKNTGTYAAIF